MKPSGGAILERITGGKFSALYSPADRDRWLCRFASIRESDSHHYAFHPFTGPG